MVGFSIQIYSNGLFQVEWETAHSQIAIFLILFYLIS